MFRACFCIIIPRSPLGQLSVFTYIDHWGPATLRLKVSPLPKWRYSLVSTIKCLGKHSYLGCADWIWLSPFLTNFLVLHHLIVRKILVTQMFSHKPRFSCFYDLSIHVQNISLLWWLEHTPTNQVFLALITLETLPQIKIFSLWWFQHWVIKILTSSCKDPHLLNTMWPK